MKPIRLLFMLLLATSFALFMVIPLYTVLARGLDPGIIPEALSTPLYRDGLVNALLVALLTTALVFVIALPPAILFDRYEFRGKALVNVMMMTPMVLPPFVGALGFQQIFGHYGVINTLLSRFSLPPVDWLGGDGRFYAVCLIEALHLYPILYLNLVTALANVDPSLDEAARNLGAGRGRRLWEITLPLIRPGIFAGGSIVLIWSFTELGTPLMLGYNTVTPVQIFNGITELESNPLPYALVVLMLFFSAGIYSGGKWLVGRQDNVQMSKGGGGGNAVKLTGFRGSMVFGLFLLITLAAGLPHLALLGAAFSMDWYAAVLPESFTLLHFQNALSHRIVVPSIVNSLKYSSLAMLFCMLAGLPAALMLVRWKPRGKAFIDLLVMMPLAVPGIIMAFGYLSMCSRYNWLNAWLDPIRNPTLLLAAAYAMRRLPYVVRSVCAGLEQTPETLEEAAFNLGAGSMTVLRRITVPLISANIVVGALFAFSFSMLEVSDSLLLAQKSVFYPITRAIFELSQILGEGTSIACAFGVWAMLFLIFSLLAAAALLGRKMGALFRF
ncbi:MAG: iron ABC transporter permease [Victivallales bacterium]|nr:iron ABC transporter permease [Victivallales bacterium]